MSKKTKPLREPLSDEARLSRLELLADTMIENAENAMDPEVQSTSARSALMIAGEVRKAKKAAKDADGELTVAQVIDWARRLPPREQQQFTRAVQGLNADAGKSGLA